MADDATDTAFGIIMFLLVLALIAYAAGGGSWSSSSTRTRTTTTSPTYSPTYQATSPTQADTTNMPYPPMEPCRGKIIANKTKSGTDGDVNIKIYYNPQDGDQNCAVATRKGWPERMQGRMTVKLWFSDYPGKEWPHYAERSIEPHANRVGGVYLDDTYNRCVSASGTYQPFTGMETVTVKVGPTGCN
jgi:hypothetical protein